MYALADLQEAEVTVGVHVVRIHVHDHLSVVVWCDLSVHEMHPSPGIRSRTEQIRHFENNKRTT